jgi:hypothetical protein
MVTGVPSECNAQYYCYPSWRMPQTLEDETMNLEFSMRTVFERRLIKIPQYGLNQLETPGDVIWGYVVPWCGVNI